jgi:hypothetical protein
VRFIRCEELKSTLKGTIIFRNRGINNRGQDKNRFNDSVMRVAA